MLEFIKIFRGHSSAGRAPAWHAGGQRFESAWLHYIFKGFKGLFRKDITFTPTWLSMFSKFWPLKCT